MQCSSFSLGALHERYRFAQRSFLPCAPLEKRKKTSYKPATARKNEYHTNLQQHIQHVTCSLHEIPQLLEA